MRRVESFALGNQRPQDIAQTTYQLLPPLVEMTGERRLVSLAMMLKLACDAHGVSLDQAIDPALNMLNEAGSSFRTENTEHVRALKLAVDGEFN